MVVALVGCSKGDSKAPPSSSSGGNAPTASATKDGYEGSITTSGLYAATWTATPGNAAEPFNSLNTPGITSDKQTMGYIGVNEKGVVKLGSGTPELAKPGPFEGPGAKVTMDKTGRFVCAFTVDADLPGHPPESKLHVSGSMKVNWHPQGLGDAACP